MALHLLHGRPPCLLAPQMARNSGLMDPNVSSQPEILDDLVDGWAANVHKSARERA